MGDKYNRSAGGEP